MLWKRWCTCVGFLVVCVAAVSSCGASFIGKLSYASQATDPLALYSLTGNTSPVLDPSIIHAGSTYYAFSTDVVGSGLATHLPIRCSQDKLSWRACGNVFPDSLPAWVTNAVPGNTGLWAPDASFFNGEYHLYYCASILRSQQSIIGLATNKSLDPADPAYRWVDRGLVLASHAGDDFNALDPNILVDRDGRVWLTYGSYWSGIKQREIDTSTGHLSTSNSTRFDLATRPGVPRNPIEGASLVHHGDYYYLFFSVDFCCEQQTSQDNYKQAVGRSSSPHGPFLDEGGTPLLYGGGTVLLEGDSSWNAPGGGSAIVAADGGDSFIVFHAQNLNRGAIPYQWIKKLGWENDWPVIHD
jgi:arabinan endo-1,5-alpha-L-arabinosidase